MYRAALMTMTNDIAIWLVGQRVRISPGLKSKIGVARGCLKANFWDHKISIG